MSPYSELKTEHEKIKPKAVRFSEHVIEQLEELLIKNNISLGVPIESRVKSWQSIEDKINRLNYTINSITQLNDLVGIRIILLFKRDIESVNDLLFKEFDIRDFQDKAIRLEDTQFGYQSIHYQLRLPKSWLKVPTLEDFAMFDAEIQVRTLAQHIWAAASHKLQYKHEESVPIPVRRSINRVAAHLETVDLEFERVLEERENYLSDIKSIDNNSQLNVEVLEQILDEILPPENKRHGNEDYSALIEDLQMIGIRTAGQLREFLANGKNIISEQLEKKWSQYTHVGLVRGIARKKYGDKFNDYMRDKYAKRFSIK